MRFLLILFTVLAFPASALAQDTDTADEDGSKATSASADTDDETANLRGTWAQKVVNSSVSKVPVVGKVTTDSIGYLLLDIEQDDDELTITSRVCDVRIDSSVKKVRTVIPDSFIKALGTETRRAEIERENGRYKFYAPRKFSTVGVQLRNQQHETLPQEPEDPRVIDPDNDGHPGVTLRIEGMINGELYVIQRAWDVMRGTLEKKRYIDGLIEWGNEQVLLDSSSVFLGSQPPSRPHPNDRRSYFRTTRVSNSATCSDVVRSRDSLFSRP